MYRIHVWCTCTWPCYITSIVVVMDVVWLPGLRAQELEILTGVEFDLMLYMELTFMTREFTFEYCCEEQRVRWVKIMQSWLHVAPSNHCPSKMRHVFLFLLNERRVRFKMPTVVYSLSKFNKLHVPVLYPISIWREKRHHSDVVLIQMTRFESCFDIGCLSNKKNMFFSPSSITYRHLAAISIGLLMWRLTLLVTPLCPLQSSGRTQTWPSRSPRTDSTRKSLISQVYVCYLLRCFSNRTRVGALVS